ncbi:MAG: glycosyltransferase [Melioribacteraceae bacterium]|nr:glycosyltransferase [Melioribacteraceae bacterium]
MDILFYGGHRWENGPWFRKQQFASRLVKKGHRVFYIQNTKSIFRSKGANPLLFTRDVKKSDNLILIEPSCFFPYPGNKYSRKAYYLKLVFELKRILKKYGVKEYLTWFNLVEFSSVVNKFEGKKIFDLADDRPFYLKLSNDEKGYQLYMEYMEMSYKYSDAHIVSAAKIKEKYQYMTDNNIIVIPNGHNFDGKFDKENTPKDLKRILDMKKPIVGFIGTLFHFLDHELMEFIIKSRPEYNFVFVGPAQSNFPVETIDKYENVYLLGKKHKDEIPNYLNYFDVCLNPFKKHEVNDSVSPVKVFEYLAQKKIVISTEMYSLMKEKISEHVIFAKDKETYLDKLDSVIKCGNYVNNITDDDLQEYHWDSLFQKLLTELKKQKDLRL